MAGCAQAPQPQQLAAGHGKEYFPASVYGPASRRVIADGQPIPHGGGQYLVGKPYTVAGQTYYPSERAVRQVGLASWYGDAFHGRLTANGEVYDRDGFTAAHPTMPLPSYARVTNLRNNYTMVVRVNDRGPYHAGRIMDVSRRVAEALDFQRGGTAKIKVEYVGRASLAGSDDSKLYATLRRGDGAGSEERSLIAEAAQAMPSRVASLLPFVSDDRREDEVRSQMRREPGERRRDDDARRPNTASRRAGIDANRDEERGTRSESRRGQGERGIEWARRDEEAASRHGAHAGATAHTGADARRPDGSDRRRLATLFAGPSPTQKDGRPGGRSVDRRPQDDAVPPPRPRARAVIEARPVEPMPPRRLHLASAESVHKGGGMRLTRSRED